MKKHVLLYMVLILILMITSATVSAQESGIIVRESGAKSSADLNNVQNSNTILVGTTADYIPYTYLDTNSQVTGLDVALIQAVAEREGWGVEFRQFPFSGLFDALSLGQVDVVIGAITVTDERKAIMDFTDVYYTSTDVIFTNAKSTISKISSAQDFKGLDVAVEKGTTHDEWATYNLVQAGIISEDRIDRYVDLNNAIEDLEKGSVDVLILDLEVAMAWLNSPTFKEVGRGLQSQSYAFALKKGSTLTSALNAGLKAIGNDGTAQAIANKFFSVKKDTPMVYEVQATQLPTSAFQPADPATASCKNGMAFIQDVTLDDHNMTRPAKVEANHKFTKTWRLMNTGTCTWTPEYVLKFVKGNHMDGDTQEIKVPMNVEPGKMINLSIELKAPDKGGVYQTFFEMFSPQKNAFGSVIYLGVQVVH